MLKITNTLTGKKEPFRPVRNRNVGMYVCGVTVYDLCHLGHARSAVVFDVIRRYLDYKKYKVRYVKNFTDVDDKIIKRANQEGKPWLDVAETYIRAYREDMSRLGVQPADREPKATEYIPEMIRLIETLVKKETAYAIDGDVYYRVKRFKNYGKLSKRDADELAAGARVEVDERKENPLDFALWKASKPGEPTWDSPWGPGRPGWHIECSAMALKLLGRGLDIHGGGKDLIFPHHENEIAQSEGATGKPFARTWIHNGFVNVNQEKMSKSLGNFFTIREVFEKSPWPEAVTAEVLRYFLVSTQYRSPIDFSDDALKSAKAGLDNFYDLFLRLRENTLSVGRADKQARIALQNFKKRFEKAMDDDFNTAIAIAEFQKLRSTMNRMTQEGISKSTAKQIESTFQKLGKVLGLFQLDPESWRVKGVKLYLELSDELKLSDKIGMSEKAHVAKIDLSDEQVQTLIMEREEARRNKDWSRADTVRKKLAHAGIIIEDRPDGTTRIKR
ncbi:MAG: cysteine--tRNA ligase [Nitrospirae bacterium]|nr:cysteine--tRNA ligase [Nitrospirota bacterium]